MKTEIIAVTGPYWRICYGRETRHYRLLIDDKDLLFFDLSVACIFARECYSHGDLMEFYRFVRREEWLIRDLCSFCSGLPTAQYLAMRPNILVDVLAYRKDCPDSSQGEIFGQIVAKYAPSYYLIS